MINKMHKTHEWFGDLSFPEKIREVTSRFWRGLADDGSRGVSREVSMILNVALSSAYALGYNDAVDAMLAEEAKQKEAAVNDTHQCT